MKKIICVALILLLHFPSSATHIIGGDVTVKSLGANKFLVTLRFYRDCLTATSFDNPIVLGVYDKITNVEAFQFSLPLISTQVLPLGDSCFTPPNLCVEEGIFRDTITFANNPNGYYISWQRCCRNNSIQNIVTPGDAAMVFYAEVPDPAIGNSTPVFGSYPNAYLCENQVNTRNFSATDADGDVLVYSLSVPLNGNATGISALPPPSAGPYSTITWQTPYSTANMIGGSPALSINSATGILSANPTTLGVYVFAVKVEEYRGGVKIGEIRRDIQFQVIYCTTNQAPVFSQPATATSSYSVIAGDSICIPIKASDPNADWVGLSATSELFSNPTTQPFTEFTRDSAIAMVQSKLCFQSNCEQIRDNPYQVNLYARDYSCYVTNTVTNVLSIYVLSPMEGELDKIIPTVFTPNNDGVNDYFKVNS